MADLERIPTPTSSADSKNVSGSGDITVDALLWGTALTSESSGSTNSITYSFSEEGSRFSTSSYQLNNGEPWSGIASLTSPEVLTFQEVLSAISHQVNITFHEVAESDASAGTIRIAWTDFDRPENSAWAYFPSDTAAASDIWLNSNTLNPNRGDLFFKSLLFHEVGHSLGLKHPSEEGRNGATLPESLDSVEHTIMSYSPSASISEAVATDLWPQSLMALDIAALQYIYGANNTATASDTIHSYNSNIRHYETLWDTGGNDTLKIEGPAHISIDLTPGTWSDIGTTIRYWNSGGRLLPDTKTHTLFITDDTVIENAEAGSGHDTIIGNKYGNIIRGGAGHDTIKGADGSDHLIGDSGSDFITGGAGSDIISGGTGYDRIFAGENDPGDDQMAGGTGNDTIGGGPGNDLLIGDGVTGLTYFKDSNLSAADEGDDEIFGGAGNDTLLGGGWINPAGENFHFDLGEENLSDEGENALWAGGGDDLVIGANGPDRLGGCKGDDTLMGAAGADTLWGGEGDDDLSGGDDSDTFVFAANHGHDVIRDFDIAEDILDLSELENEFDLAGALETAEISASGILLITSETSSILLEGLTLDDVMRINIVIEATTET